MTYGQIRMRVVKEAPGVDLALIDGYLLDRYVSILDRLKWRRQDAEVVLVTVAPYTTGTLLVTEGSAALVLTDGTFTAAMTGRSLRVDGREEWYEFTRVGATTGTLDREYEGETETAATYSIYQNIYPLPADCRVVNGITSAELGPLGKMSRTELNATAAGRPATGTPRLFAPYMDNASDPPLTQIEVYPIPDAVVSLVVSYTAEASAIAGTDTTILPWLRPAALIAGATADALEHLENYQRADRQKLKYEEYLADMMRTESLARGPQPMRLANWMTRHNLERAARSAGNRSGPRLP
jgi:hypothetical protein